MRRMLDIQINEHRPIESDSTQNARSNRTQTRASSGATSAIPKIS
jgi:hypothetical protein